MRRALASVAVLAALCAGPAFADPDPVSPQYAASGVPSVTCTISSVTTCAAPTLIPGRNFHVSHKLTGFTGACQWERQIDGTNWYTITVTSGGSTTQMYNWSFSASTQNISEDLEETQAGVAQRLNCTAASAGSDVVTISQ